MSRLHPDVAWVTDPDTGIVYAGLLPAGPLLVLADSSAVIFEALAAGEDPVAAIVQVWPEAGEHAGPAVRAHVAELEQVGLLVPEEGARRPRPADTDPV
ncbi:hypothetical protein [Ornithinimicrobium sp. Y1694]|uniref:hypothetical protein n=1 Tax=Ornithinimicrobium sp. Y1694 TaxID=3418590 RepID=UPI003CF174A8